MEHIVFPEREYLRPLGQRYGNRDTSYFRRSQRYASVGPWVIRFRNSESLDSKLLPFEKTNK